MFSWIFGFDKDNNETISNLFHYTLTNNNKQTIKLITEYKIDLNSKECKDKYNNTLLHILANGNNITLARQLILQGLRRDHVNIFNEKAVDIALKNNNLAMVRVLTDIVQDSKLLERITSLEVQKKVLDVKIGKANEEIETLKRKRCDKCDINERECKRLKIENNELVKTNENLTKDNIDLQTTIHNLRQSFKKS